MSPTELAVYASWTATGLGVALWIASYFRPRGSVARMRFNDAGSVLIFGGILVRIAIQGGPKNPLDWLLLVVGPLFAGVALYRLFRTQGGDR